MKQKIVVLTGAGMSAESGISTFRDADGLWENHSIEEVASPEGFARNPALVLDFYNQRRRQLKEVEPNKGHDFLKELETDYDVQIITQNVDDLHERAGSANVLHLHGELRKVRSTQNPDRVYEWTEDLVWGDQAEDGAQLRPHIVWFGEAVPAISEAATIISDADKVLIIGTSMQVYPAASLYEYAPKYASIYVVNPVKTAIHSDRDIQFITKTAVEAVPELKEIFMK